MICPRCKGTSFTYLDQHYDICSPGCGHIVDKNLQPVSNYRPKKPVLVRKLREVDVLSNRIHAAVAEKADEITSMIMRPMSYDEINAKLGFTWGKAATKRHYEDIMAERGITPVKPLKMGKGRDEYYAIQAALKANSKQIAELRAGKVFWSKIKESLDLPGSIDSITKQWTKMGAKCLNEKQH